MTNNLSLLSVIGCADPKLPPDVWSRRNGDKLVIQCNATDQVWTLTCRNNKWVGDTGNCTTGSIHFIAFKLVAGGSANQRLRN